MIERIRNAVRILIGLLIIAFAVWGFFYQFHIWPWSGEWWNIPAVITAASVAISIGVYGGKLVDK